MSSKFLDFHVMVRRLLPEPNGVEHRQYVTVVADAPTPRWQLPVQIFDINSLSKEIGRETDAELTRQPQVRAEETGVRTCRVAHAGSQPLEPERARKFRRTIGELLFRHLFPDDSQSYRVLADSCRVAADRHARLRVKLDLDQDLWPLPWELLTPPKTGRYFSEIDRARRRIVRYLGDVTHRELPTPIPTKKKQTLLVIRGHSTNLEGNDDISQSLDQELERLKNIVGGSLANVLAVKVIDGGDKKANVLGTLNELHEVVSDLRLEQCEVVGLHLMGHGGIDGQDGYFLGKDEHGAPYKIYGEELRAALDTIDSIQWAILNACSSAKAVGCPLTSFAAYLAAQNSIPWVIAYLRPFDTIMAETVTRRFYERVLGTPPDAIEDVVDNLQEQFQREGGLVMLQLSVEGLVQPDIGQGVSPPVPPLRPQADRGEEVFADAPVSPKTEPSSSGRRPVAPKTIATNVDLDFLPVAAGPYETGLRAEQRANLLRRLEAKGTFSMWTNLKELIETQEPGTDSVSAFSLKRTPVTNAQFRAFVEDTGYRTTAEQMGDPRNWRSSSESGKLDHPVVSVSFIDAQEYCEWARCRLPTDSEWVKAYRGPKGRIYPWGDAFDPELCNTNESYAGFTTTPVTMFPNGASYYGCLDLLGNVEEWTQSHVDDHDAIIIRSGSFCDPCEIFGLPFHKAFGMREAYTNDLGFRCARDGA